MKSLQTYLSKFSEADWLAAVNELLPLIHEVDRNAVQIWFRFYPLALERFIDAAEDCDATLHGIVMKGDFELANQIDTSHHFLFGHRFWKATKLVIEGLTEEFQDQDRSITEIARTIADRVAQQNKVDMSLTLAIAFVGMMTINQVGPDAFKAAAGDVDLPEGKMKKSPDRIVAERAKDDPQGLFGFLKTIDKTFTVRYIAQRYAGKFPVMADQEVTQASARDQSKNWKELDDRCWEGPVPVECTSASCGTCWVGILGGQEKLNEVSRRERRATKVFGYNQPDEPKPVLRLACQTRATGNVTLVIPPWNAVFGKKVYGNVDELELEPVTTSAKALRETIRSAASGD
jgi:ferredoxin